MHRRDVLRLFTATALAGVMPRTLARAAEQDGLYEIGRFGNARVLHMTDTHAQLLPVHFREPSVNIGIGSMSGHPPHLVGEAFLKHFGIEPKSRAAHAFTCLDFADAGKFDEAVKHAQEAEALANGSIAQAKEQEKLWPDAVVR